MEIEMNAKERSDHYATHNAEPTMTDQSGAADTDINLIVKRYGVYGTAPGSAHPPIYGDFADIPQDLRDKINLIRSIPELRKDLPSELDGLTLADLNLPPDQLAAKIPRPAPTPAPTGEPPK